MSTKFKVVKEQKKIHSLFSVNVQGLAARKLIATLSIYQFYYYYFFCYDLVRNTSTLQNQIYLFLGSG